MEEQRYGVHNWKRGRGHLSTKNVLLTRRKKSESRGKGASVENYESDSSVEDQSKREGKEIRTVASCQASKTKCTGRPEKNAEKNVKRDPEAGWRSRGGVELAKRWPWGEKRGQGS